MATETAGNGQAAEVSAEQVERATNLLDVRKIIGGLLGVYGVILLGAGIFGSDADKQQAAGVNINLWVGLALMLACGVFWAWALWRPLTQELEEGSSERAPDANREGEGQDTLSTTS
ncbi:MAG TPA: hypothetical protein VE270_08465 [Thermoleophilaceae bacterium]|nr:hypothetical protein [Thermoleophilaceae bacterium]